MRHSSGLIQYIRYLPTCTTMPYFCGFLNTKIQKSHAPGGRVPCSACNLGIIIIPKFQLIISFVLSRRRGSGIHRALSGACFWILTRQSDSHHVAYMHVWHSAIANYCCVWELLMCCYAKVMRCHDDHMICCILGTQKSAWCIPDPFPPWGQDLETRLLSERFSLNLRVSE